MEKLWVSKYRPASIEEMCLPVFLRERFHTGQIDAHLLFAGKPGTGKTTLARILVKGLVLLPLNGSVDRSIEVVRHDITEFVSTNSVLTRGKPKAVFVEEADRFTPEAQDALKALMEQYEDYVRFVFVSNHPERLIPALRSRFEFVDFDFSSTEVIADLQVQYGRKILSILKSENNMSITPDAMNYLLTEVYPDLRKITGTLYSATRQKDAGYVVTLDDLKANATSADDDLYTFLCAAYKPEDVFMKIKTDYTGRERDAMKSLGVPFLEFLSNHERLSPKVLSASMIVQKYTYELNTGDIDPLLNLLACCSALTSILK